MLDRGRIVARGTHDDLLRSSGTYRALVGADGGAEEPAT